MSARSMIRAHGREADRRSRRTGRRSRRVGGGAALTVGATLALAAPAHGAGFQVKSSLDNGDGTCDATCTLRDAIDDANGNGGGADTITFAASVSGTILLTSGDLDVLSAMTISGPGADVLRVSGNDAGRVFSVDVNSIGGAHDPVTISGLSIVGGNSPTIGGGLYAETTDLTLDRVAVRDNITSGAGGGVYANHSKLTISDSTIAGNRSGGAGGGLYTSDDAPAVPGSSAAVVRNATIAGNHATGGAGGGAYFDDTTDSVLVDHSTVSANTAVIDSGGIKLYGPDKAPGVIRDSTISGNVAGQKGGGLYVRDQYNRGALIENTTITGNVAGFGGPGSGGGLFRHASTGTVALSSTIVADNTATDPGVDLGGQGVPNTTVSAGFSLIGNATTTGVTLTQAPPGSNLLGVDPKLQGDLGDNGGPTQTQMIARSSPAVDAGTANGLLTDQRGLARTVKQPGASAAGSDGTDIGALELPDRTLKSPKFKARRTQRQRRGKIVVKVVVGAGEDVTAKATGSIKANGKVPLRPAHAQVEDGRRATLSLKPKSKRSAKEVAALLAKGKRLTAKIRATLTDGSGNSKSKALRVKLKAAKPRRK